ncbi:hypothetical protein HG537_0G00540 [Torulaspora globosa]|uniref:RRM domain-containing protein n=1 Tax=Torulaspora globosa TaxID=48254 RepID=A0A7H9HWQ1_9SACH|nr:hypothetical protein HG537_0G00540 [Torulaspora sp. CBS 2947]
MHSKGSVHQNQQSNHMEYGGSSKMMNTPVVYPKTGSMGNQFVNAQPVFYHAGPVMNAPPTPFDTAYGVTLLPSHLLMGSPFVSSPDLFQQSHYHQFANQRRHGSGHSKPSSGRNFGKVATAYPAPPPLSSPPMSRNAGFPLGSRDSYCKPIRTADASKLFGDPFVLTYTILPRGNDEFRTRSLLLENVNNSIDLHGFITNHTISAPVESVYMFEKEKDSNHVSILLSFFSRTICLDFYNSVLQRFSEYKSDLDSKGLTLSFVALVYKVPGTNREVVEHEDDTKLDAFSITAAGSLRYDIINRGATRSIAITFDKECFKEELIDKKLEFLKAKTNSRYVLESIDLISAKESIKNFPENYAILTFLNIFMAVEMLDYIRLHSRKLGIVSCFFVSVLPQSSDNKRRSISASSNGMSSESGNISYRDKNGSITSLESSSSLLSLDPEVDEVTSSLEKTKLEKYLLEIKASQYKDPTFQAYTDHLPNVTVSEAASMEYQLYLPRPQEVTVNEVSLPSQDLSFSGEMEMIRGGPRFNTATQPMSHLNSFANTSDSPYMPSHSASHESIINKQITQNLQRHYATSAEVSSSMGGGVGNRTIYIGNIHPRSKAEDICNVVRGGILQGIKFLPERHICFVTFIEAASAVQFYTNAFIDPIVLHGNMLKVGWGHHSGPLPKSISLAVTVGASRNVYVSLPEYAFKDKYINDPQYKEYAEKYKLPTEQQLRKDFSHYGEIEQINYLSDGHCCWVNFMNISAAIKLVEEVKYDDEKKSGEFFNKRYEGLIIGYGKDRCGNVNKNLIAGKNSRFYKKVKKPSFNIRLSKMEAERRQHEENLRNQQRNNSEQLLQFGSLGITLDPDGKKSSDDDSVAGSEVNVDFMDGTKKTVKQEDGKESEQEERELFKLSNKSEISEGLGIIDSAEDDEKDKNLNDLASSAPNGEEAASHSRSDVSSEIELIIQTPADDRREAQTSHPTEGSSKEKTKSTSEKGKKAYDVSTTFSSLSLEANPPIAPATISRNYSLMLKKQYKDGKVKEPENETKINKGQDASSEVPEANSRRKGRSKRRQGKFIPGSDVMAQYLAQLQHSTFIYAANILGASNEEESLDENTRS